MEIAGRAGSALVVDGRLRIADPGEQALHEAVALRHSADHVDHLAVHQAEIARIFRDLVRRDGIVRAVIEAGSDAFGPAIAGAATADTEHHLMAVAPLSDHLGQDLGRVLHVDVHRDDRAAAGVVEPGTQRGFLAEVARQA